MNKLNNKQYIDDEYDDLKDENAQRRAEKKKPKMKMDSAFLRQVPKIQEKRFEKKYHRSFSTDHTDDISVE